MYVRHGGVWNSRHTDPRRRNVSWWFRTVSVCENCTSSHTRRVKDAKEISQGEIKLFQHHPVWKSHASPSSSFCSSSSFSPPETHSCQTLKSREMEKKKAELIKPSLCFVSMRVNIRITDCSIFSPHRRNAWRRVGWGWCKTYSCCSVLERGLTQGGGKDVEYAQRSDTETKSRENTECRLHGRLFTWLLLFNSPLMHSPLQPDQLFTQYFLFILKSCHLAGWNKSKH